MQKIRPFLWFDGRAEEAATFYVSIFKDAEILTPPDDADPGPFTSVTFRLGGSEYIAFNGGPAYAFTPAFSLLVTCDTQQEIDEYWSRLSDGGEEGRCGWLQDKFGMSWQIVPLVLPDLLGDDDPKRAEAARQAMYGMKKLDIAALQRARDDA